MKKYDASQTRIAAIRQQVYEIFGDLDLELLSSLEAARKGNRSGIIIDVAPAFSRSTREPLGQGRGSYDWEDLVGVRVIYHVDTGDMDELAAGAAKWAHDLERAVERWQPMGQPQIKNDECEIEVWALNIEDQLQSLVIDKSRGAVIMTLTAGTRITWKKQK